MVEKIVERGKRLRRKAWLLNDKVRREQTAM